MGALGAEKLPAPNAYDKDSKNAVLRTAPSFGFGTSKRTLVSIEAMKVPGPGAYPIKSIVGTKTTSGSKNYKHVCTRAWYIQFKVLSNCYFEPRMEDWDIHSQR